MPSICRTGRFDSPERYVRANWGSALSTAPSDVSVNWRIRGRKDPISGDSFLMDAAVDPRSRCVPYVHAFYRLFLRISDRCTPGGSAWRRHRRRNSLARTPHSIMYADRGLSTDSPGQNINSEDDRRISPIGVPRPTPLSGGISDQTRPIVQTQSYQ